MIWVEPYTLRFLLVQNAASPHDDTAVHIQCINGIL